MKKKGNNVVMRKCINVEMESRAKGTALAEIALPLKMEHRFLWWLWLNGFLFIILWEIITPH